MICIIDSLKTLVFNDSVRDYLVDLRSMSKPIANIISIVFQLISFSLIVVSPTFISIYDNDKYITVPINSVCIMLSLMFSNYANKTVKLTTYQKLQNQIDTQNKKIAHLEDELSKQNKIISVHDDKFSVHDDKLAAHDNTLMDYNTKLNIHDGNFSAHDDRLIDHDNKFAVQDDRLSNHDSKLVAHENRLSDHDIKFSEHDKIFETHYSKLKYHDNKLKEQEMKTIAFNESIHEKLSRKQSFNKYEYYDLVKQDALLHSREESPLDF